MYYVLSTTSYPGGSKWIIQRSGLDGFYFFLP